MKKQFFAIVDTETTIKGSVADIGCIIIDRAGKIHHQLAVLVREEFTQHDLFFDKSSAGHWSYDNMLKKKAAYNEMLASGERTLASVGAVNRWLAKAAAQYDATLTAYNLPFDSKACKFTGIDLSVFNRSFCLWKAANNMIVPTRGYKQFVLENHLFNSPTVPHGNMTFRTDAEAVAGYLAGVMTEEPHTALEDAREYEAPILLNIIRRKNWGERVHEPYNWKARQVKDHFKPA